MFNHPTAGVNIKPTQTDIGSQIAERAGDSYCIAVAHATRTATAVKNISPSMAPSFEQLDPETEFDDEEEEIDFSGVYFSQPLSGFRWADEC